MSDPHGWSRRDFVKRSATASLVIPIGALSDRLPAQAVQENWVGWARAQIPASAESTYFQTGGIGPSPRVVMEAMSEVATEENRGPADPRFSRAIAEIEPTLREHLSRVFHVPPGGVALTHSTSEGISIAAWSRNWAEGDEVILSNQEHPANVVPWYLLRDRFGLVIREIDLDAGTHLIDEVRSMLNPRTRMVSISHVSRNNGRRIRTSESAELAGLLRAAGVIYHLDGAQGPGCVPVDFDALGCDCYSTCGHKWLLGPKGTGAFFVRPEQLERIRLSWAGSHSHQSMDYEGAYTLLPSAARFEFGTRALADFAGFDRAVSWMEDVGLERILNRTQRLVSYAIERVKETGRLEISSPEAEADRSGVFVLRLPAGCEAAHIYERLAEERRVLTAPVRRERDLRISIHFFNTEDEIDEALAAVLSACRVRRRPA
jgi:selenocysteine lyase/cysteine desulfurase